MPTQGIEGVWETDFGDLVLETRGPFVTGTYSPHDGRVEGTLAGDILQGNWFQQAADGSGMTRGVFTLTFSPDGRSFAGRWSYLDANGPGGGSWSGWR